MEHSSFHAWGWGQGQRSTVWLISVEHIICLIKELQEKQNKQTKKTKLSGLLRHPMIVQRIRGCSNTWAQVCLSVCVCVIERERDTLEWIGMNLRFSLGSYVRNLESFLMRPPLMFPDKHCFNCASILCLTSCDPYTHRIQTIRGILIHPHNRCDKIA